jgi:pteridine reductase
MASTRSNSPVALVTGSGKRRVGWYVADLLSQHGYKLAIHYHSSAQEATETAEHFQSRGIQAVPLQADLRDETQTLRLIQKVLERFGRIDVLVNCAAVYGAKKFEDIKAADVRLNFETNLLGTFLCCQQAGLAMVQQPEGGCIINFGDWAEARPYLDYAAYFASKGAIPALTRCLAVELGSRNPHVRVNCILPGPVLFPPDMPPDERQRAIDATLAKREGRPENIAQAVLCLIANDFITGACLNVDGGRLVYAGADTLR